MAPSRSTRRSRTAVSSSYWRRSSGRRQLCTLLSAQPLVQICGGTCHTLQLSLVMKFPYSCLLMACWNNAVAGDCRLNSVNCSCCIVLSTTLLTADYAEKCSCFVTARRSERRTSVHFSEQSNSSHVSSTVGSLSSCVHCLCCLSAFSVLQSLYSSLSCFHYSIMMYELMYDVWIGLMLSVLLITAALWNW